MELMEKVSYLKGLVDMAEFDPASKETKVLNAMIAVMDELAKTVQSLSEANDQLCDVIESIDEDLSQVEEDLYGDEDADEDEEEYDEEDGDEEEDGDLYEVTCPTCGETFDVDEFMLDEGEINCPACGERLEFDLQIDDPPAKEEAAEAPSAE